MSTGQPRNVPVMVRAARLAAEQRGFTESCTDEVGQLLELLVSQFTADLIGEIGGGAGVGTAWMVSGLQPDSRLISIELDEELAASTRRQFGDHTGVAILQGDWRTILDYGPFGMLFVDVVDATDRYLDDVIDALRPGGLAIIDKLTPGVPDPLRDLWLGHDRLRSIELTLATDSSVILATRRR